MADKQPSRELTLQQKNLMREDLMWDPLAWEGIQKIANIFISSGAVPDSIKNVAQMVMVLQAGREVGAKPVEAMRTIALVKGKITMEGRLLIRKMHEAGVKIEYLRRDKTGASMKFTYKDRAPYETTITMDDLPAEKKKSSTYTDYGRDMFVWKCVQDAAKFYVPDIIQGIEVSEVIMEEQEVIEAATLPTAKERAAEAIAAARQEDAPADKKPDNVVDAQVVDVPTKADRKEELEAMNKDDLKVLAKDLEISDHGKKDELIKRIVKAEKKTTDAPAEAQTKSEEPAPAKVEATKDAKPSYEDIAVALDHAGSMEDLESVKALINKAVLTGEEGRSVNEFFAEKVQEFSKKEPAAPSAPKGDDSVLGGLFAARNQ